MKVAILSESTEWGGLESHALALAETVVDAGHQAVIGCVGADALRLYTMMARDSVELVELWRPAKQSARNWWVALRRLDADAVVLEKGTLRTGGVGLDIVLRWKYGSNFLAVQQLEPPILPPRASRRYVGGLIPGTGLWWYRWKWSGYIRSIGPRFTVCVSEAVRRRLIGDYAFPIRKTVTIPNGVDIEKFSPRAEARAAVRRSWGISPDAFVFGSLGRFSAQKALDVAIDSFCEIARREAGREVHLVLVGEGSERLALEAQVRRLGLERRVLFPGFMTRPSEAYQGFDVFLIPSRYEGLPFALVEAMASGCRVIASRVGGIPEVISSPGVGALVAPDDVASLADAMVAALAQSPEAALAQVNVAHGRVAEDFDIRVQCRRILALLEPTASLGTRGGNVNACADVRSSCRFE